MWNLLPLIQIHKLGLCYLVSNNLCELCELDAESFARIKTVHVGSPLLFETREAGTEPHYLTTWGFISQTIQYLSYVHAQSVTNC